MRFMLLNFSNPEIIFALESVSQASKLVAEVPAEVAGLSLTKNDRSPVTVADLGAQAIVAALLSEHFPQDALVAEENSAVFQTPEGKAALERVTGYVCRWRPNTSPAQVIQWIDRGTAEPKNRFWTLDPIDGTKGFLRGGQYAVALALIENGEVKIGVLVCPRLREGTLAIAVKGQGSWQTPLQKRDAFLPMAVSSRKEPSEAIMLRSFENSHTDTARTEKWTEQLSIKTKPVLMDSLAKYALLAAGDADIQARFPFPESGHQGEWVWDLAAGAILVEEAGGKVTDLGGKKLDYAQGRRLSANRGILATNGHLHSACLLALKS